MLSSALSGNSCSSCWIRPFILYAMEKAAGRRDQGRRGNQQWRPGQRPRSRPVRSRRSTRPRASTLRCRGGSSPPPPSGSHSHAGCKVPGARPAGGDTSPWRLMLISFLGCPSSLSRLLNLWLQSGHGTSKASGVSLVARWLHAERAARWRSAAGSHATHWGNCVNA